MVYDKGACGILLTDNLLQKEAEGAEVSAAAIGMTITQKLHLVCGHDAEGQFLKLMVYIGGKYREFPFCLGVCYRRTEFFGYVPQAGSLGHGYLPSKVLTQYFYFFHVSISLRNGPVTESGLAESSSGVPWATILPPPRPPSGPRSKM